MKKIISTLLCFFILLGCVLPAWAATGVPKEVMDSTKSVVRILSKYYSGSATGSGFVIKNEPGEVLIVTNDHVVEGDPYSISVWVSDDELVDAEIVFTTSQKDLCVLKVTDKINMKPLTLSREEPQHGAAIYVVGYPGAGDILSDTQAHTSESVTITDGIISAIRSFTIEKGGKPVKLLQVNAAINSGNSGGPLFNTKGEVIGINTYKVNADSQGVFGSVAVSELLALLDKHNIEIPVATSSPSNSVAVIIGAVAVLLVVILLISVKKKKAHKKTAKRSRTKEKSVTLTTYMQQYPQGLGVNGAVSLLLGAAIQLRSLHNDGKLHLQICPDNILISANGVSIKDPSNQETSRYNSGFAAPEVYKGAGFGITSDIYSFAAVLLYAVTGQVPTNSLQLELVEQQIDTITESAFTGVLCRAMAFGILERTQSMQELISGIAVYNTAAQEMKPVRELPKPKAITQEEPKPTAVSIKEKQKKQPKQCKQKTHNKRTTKVLPVAAVLTCVIAVVVFFGKPLTKGKVNIQLNSSEQTEVIELTEEEIAYAEAEQLLADGETAKAAIAFGKLGDYSDARNRSFALWDEVAVRDTICAMGGLNELGTAGLMSDGTVLLTGGASSKFPHRKQHWEAMSNDVDTWTDIIAIASGSSLFGLKADGSVNVAAPNGLWSEVEQWQDIVSISASDYFVIGLKMDGTVQVISGKSSNDEENDRLAWIPELSKWTDIVAVSAGTYNAVGLRANGTVVVLGEPNREKYWREIEQWQNIITISTGHYGDTLGLKADGTLLSAGGYIANGDWDVSQWHNIVDFSVGYHQVLGVKSDGTVVAAGYNHNGCISVKNWTDIIAVDTNGNSFGWHTVGLKSDGTLVAVGDNSYGQCKVQSWTDIALPGQLTAKPKDMPPADQQTQYDAAEKILADGETAKAAIAFGKLGDYKDARERSFELWREVVPSQVIYSGLNSTAAVRKDGTVLLAGYADSRQRQCLEWTDIVSISTTASPQAGHTVGLKEDGTVVAVGANQWGQCNVSSWSDIVAIDTRGLDTVGLTSDGTVLYTGRPFTNTETDIIQKLSHWENIIAISTSWNTIFGLKADGTVVAAGSKYSNVGELVKDWSDIIAVSANDTHVAGLKADGTVVDTDNNSYVLQWSDIIAVAAGNGFTIGLKSDGTVVATGLCDGMPLDLSGWSDIAAISAYSNYAIGVKNDGSVVFVGTAQDSALIENWSDIKLPN